MKKYLKKQTLIEFMTNKRGYEGFWDARVLLGIVIAFILWLVWKAFFS